MIGKAFILLITNEIDKKTIIKNDIKTIPNDFKFDLRLRTCRVEIINPAKIQNCVRKIIGIINSGVTAKNLKDLDDICDECKEQHESVTQNLILTGFKICKSCRVSKTIFPI